MQVAPVDYRPMPAPSGEPEDAYRPIWSIV